MTVLAARSDFFQLIETTLQDEQSLKEEEHGKEQRQDTFTKKQQR